MLDRGRGSVITMVSGAARRPGGAPIAYAAALFLASDASSWITGITLDVAGGQIMQ